MALTGWSTQNKIKIVIPASKIISPLTNYPIKIYLSTASGSTGHDCTPVFTELGSAKLKIAIEIGNTGTQCVAEAAYWDDTGLVAEVVFKAPSISDTTDNTFYFYFDASHADNTTYIGVTGSTVGKSVYDTDFVAAWNMCQDPSGGAGCILDSAAGAINGTPSNMVAGDLVDFGPGKGLDFNGTDAFIDLGNTSALDFGTADRTVEVMFTPHVVSSSWRTYQKRGTGAWTYAGWMVAGSDDLYNTLISDGDDNYVRGSTTTSIAVDTKYLLTLVWDNSTGVAKTYINGVYFETLAETGDMSGKDITTSRNATFGCAWDDSSTKSQFLNGIIGEVRDSDVIRSDAWIAATSDNFFDDLLLLSSIQFEVAITQPYGAGTTGLSATEQIWGLMHDPAVIKLVKLWHILDGPVSSELVRIWGFALEAAVNKYYENAPVAITSLVKRYLDTATPETGLGIRYDDALSISAALNKIYHIMTSTNTSVDKIYTITEGEVKASLDILWDLTQYNEPLKIAISQIYGIIGKKTNVLSYTMDVIASGTKVYPSEINIVESIDNYIIEIQLGFSSQSDFATCQDNGSLTFYDGTTTYEFFVSEKRRSRSRVNIYGVSSGYIVIGLSWAASLDRPYHLPITQDWPSGGLASEICQSIAGDITIDWQIIDWFIPAATLFANDETPIQIIRKIIRNRGVMQDNASGKTLSIVKEYAVSPPKWAETAPDYTLSDLDDIGAISENIDERSGVNKIIVTNQLSSDKRLYISDEQVNSSTRLVMGYRTPWIETFTLDHSGGSWVSVIDNGIVNELIEKEFIEFVDGTGRASQPIYSLSVIDWQEYNLGGLTFAEDGMLQASINGNSIAEISYYTKYRSWTVKDNENEKVQVFLRVTDND